MFTFTIYSRVVHPTLLNGFLSSLKAFREKNPEWNYELIRHDNAHLTLLDFTAYDALTDITAAEYEGLCRQVKVLRWLCSLRVRRSWRFS